MFKKKIIQVFDIVMKQYKKLNIQRLMSVLGILTVYSLIFAGCSSYKQYPVQSNKPVAVYQINYNSHTKTLSLKSIDVTPPLAGQNMTGKAGVFQVGNAIFNGSLVTAPVYIVNNDSVSWTGVEMQAYTVISGNPTVADADLGTGWYTNIPAYGAWGWLFTSGTAGSVYTITSGGQSLNKIIGFYATSDFVARVYIYANVPVISSITPAVGLIGSTVTISGYNFSTTWGSVTFNGVPATVQSWTDNSIVVTVPAGVTSGDVIVQTVDTNTPYSNGVLFTPCYSISGTVGYTGSTTGWVYINVENAGGGSTMYGTSISGAGTFTIHGVPSGTYVLSAWLDNIGTGTRHASNPTGTSTAFSVNSSNVTGISISLSDPGPITLSQSPGLMGYAGSGTVLVGFSEIQDSYGIEIPESYNVYWSTSITPCSTAGGGVTSVVANTMGVFLQSGLSNGTTYYYSIQGVVGGNPGPCSSAYPVTPTTNSGSYTVSGTITNNVTPTGPLYIAIGIGGNHGAPVFYGLESIPSPSNTQSYSIAGIPNGTYSLFVIEDMNNDNTIDVGDITSGINGNGATITVNGGNVTQDITLTGANAFASVTTQNNAGTYTGYNLNANINGEIKLPVGVELTAGPNVVVPVDIGNTGTNGGIGSFQGWFNLSNTPSVGDTYTFALTYSDATTENLNASVTGVLDSFATATFPTATDDGDGVTIPTFTWNAPSSPPSPYTYSIWINPSNCNGNCTIWEPKNNLPSSQTSALYNFDGSASQSSLTIGTTYNWTISVVDSYGNSAQYQTQWSPGQNSNIGIDLQFPYVFEFDWGGAGSLAGEFNSPTGITLDNTGNVYVVDTYNSRIQEFDSNGNLLQIWGSYGTSAGQFSGPTGIAVDSSNYVYVADTNNNRIQKFDNSGNFITAWTVSSYPSSIAVVGSSYIITTSNSGIQMFDTSGTFITTVALNPNCVAVDSSGNVYGIAGTTLGEFNSAGNLITSWTIPSNGSYPSLSVDSYGYIYIVNSSNQSIEKYNNAGTLLTSFGIPSTYIYPYGIAVDGYGNVVYVTDQANNVVDKFTR
jgi:sugar lactone lactonase YvrE